MPFTGEKRRSALWNLMRWPEGRELLTLAVLVMIAGSLWAFIELADEVMEGATEAYDRALLLAFRNPEDLGDPLGPAWVEELARDFTALGGVGVLTFITLAASGLLILDRKVRAAGLVLVAIVGGLTISLVLKHAFGRPRPDLVPHASYVVTASFPSGHSMMSAVAYLTLGALLARVYGKRRIRVYLLTLAIVMVILIGVSRVYLGVHWPTDVLAGWTVGSAWALICWLAARWLQQRGQIERHGEKSR